MNLDERTMADDSSGSDDTTGQIVASAYDDHELREIVGELDLRAAADVADAIRSKPGLLDKILGS